MKLFLKAFLFLTVFAAILNSCKKTSIFDEQGNLEANSDFNATNIKTWYYKTFENSAEGALKGTDKKYPIWKNGIYYKLSTFEVFEFPLIKNKNEMSVPSNLSQADKKRVAESSLARIRFIKDKIGKISVVEVNYIPEIQYLRNNNYDISNVAMGEENSDFTGRMILKKWNGEFIARYIFNDGIATGKIKNKNTLSTLRDNNVSSNFGEVSCPAGQEAWCTYHNYCDVYPDGLQTNCTDWEIVGDCWCEGTPSDPCEGLSAEDCACQKIGVCGVDNHENDCSNAIEDANEEFNNGTSST